MDDRRVGSWIARTLVATYVLALVAGVASAHEVAGSRFDAPLPLPLLFAGAGGTVALTAVWLGATDSATPFSDRTRHLLTIPREVARPIRHGSRGLFLASVVAALVLGLVGRQVAAENFATVFTWPVWFRGVALIAILIGNPWRTLSPWRTVYRGLVRLEGNQLAVLGSAPALGAWPALVGFVVLIGVLENLTAVPRSPRLTTAVVAVYALVAIGGAVLYGPSWLRRIDPLGVLYRLFGRVAAIRISRTEDGGYAIEARPPWRGCLTPVENLGLVAFVVATVYTVSFDGFTNTEPFQAILLGLRAALGTGPGTSVLLYVAGLAGFLLTFALVIWAVERLGAGTGHDWRAAAQWFAPTVLPIAAAYEVAHNYPYVIGNLDQLVTVALDPIAPGIGSLDPLGWLSLPAFWGSQVFLIVVGHVVAVVAAHHVAVERYDSVREARRGHVPLVVLMIGYTVLSLWIVSQPVIS